MSSPSHGSNTAHLKLHHHTIVHAENISFRFSERLISIVARMWWAFVLMRWKGKALELMVKV